MVSVPVVRECNACSENVRPKASGGMVIGCTVPPVEGTRLFARRVLLCKSIRSSSWEEGSVRPLSVTHTGDAHTSGS